MYGCVFHKEDGFCEKFSDDRCKSYCVMGPCQYAIPSNADHIRAMSDEELGVFLAEIYTLDTDAYGDYDPCVVIAGNKFRGPDELIDWLKAPVDKED